jgi:hypothetical protein
VCRLRLNNLGELLSTYRRLKSATAAELDGYFHNPAFAENPVASPMTPKSFAAAMKPVS